MTSTTVQRTLLQAFSSSVLWFAVACGGETSEAAACPAENDCGGDIAGRWDITTVCDYVTNESLTSTGLPAECTAAFMDAESRATRQYTDAWIDFGAAGTLHQAGRLRSSVPWAIDAACLRTFSSPADDLNLACNDFRDLLLASIPQGEVTATCELNGATCDCQQDLDLSLDHEGTYRLVEGKLVLGGNVPASYCVQGNVAALTLHGAGVDGTLGLRRH